MHRVDFENTIGMIEWLRRHNTETELLMRLVRSTNCMSESCALSDINLMDYIPSCLWIIQNKSLILRRTELLFLILI